MKLIQYSIFLLLLGLMQISLTACSQQQNKKVKMTNKYKQLSPEEERIILHKGTERPFTGKYVKHKEKGVYVCKQCGNPLYKSDSKFDSHCGWPSFDQEIEGAVKRVPDKDGIRTEIICANCGGHLGHVFLGEGYTDKNTRHCVNSLSLGFDADSQQQDKMKKAYFAGGCFWGVEYYLQQLDGVEKVISGYMGGNTENPSYEEVCSGKSGHIETVEVVYNPEKINYQKIAKTFFEIHDPTQANGQGPDIGEQYISVVFYQNEEEKQMADTLIHQLEKNGYKVATKLIKAETFWAAEDYHQDYYERKGKKPYCHGYVKRF